MPCLVVKKIEVRWVLVLAGSLGRVAELDMMVGLAANRRSEGRLWYWWRRGLQCGKGQQQGVNVRQGDWAWK